MSLFLEVWELTLVKWLTNICGRLEGRCKRFEGENCWLFTFQGCWNVNLELVEWQWWEFLNLAVFARALSTVWMKGSKSMVIFLGVRSFPLPTEFKSQRPLKRQSTFPLPKSCSECRTPACQVNRMSERWINNGLNLMKLFYTLEMKVARKASSNNWNRIFFCLHTDFP
jgi:hypothetical protein